MGSKSLTAAIAIVAAMFLVPTGLGAHSEVFERAPEAGQVVTGTVDHVDISFWAPVESATITVLDPDGSPLDVSATELAPNKRITSVEFAPLTVEGRYTVVHAELSADGDEQEASFSFVYDADRGDRVASLFVRDTGPNWALLGIIGGVVLVGAGLFWPRGSKR